MFQSKACERHFAFFPSSAGTKTGLPSWKWRRRWGPTITPFRRRLRLRRMERQRNQMISSSALKVQRVFVLFFFLIFTRNRSQPDVLNHLWVKEGSEIQKTCADSLHSPVTGLAALQMEAFSKKNYYFFLKITSSFTLKQCFFLRMEVLRSSYASSPLHRFSMNFAAVIRGEAEKRAVSCWCFGGR